MSEKLQISKVQGELSAAGFRFGIVVSRFNSFITERLLAAAVDALERAGAASKDVDVVHVPGAFELPLAAKKLAATGKYDALIAARADGQRLAYYVLRADLRNAGASHRPRRAQGREQRIRSGARRHRNGSTITQASRFWFDAACLGKATAEVTCLCAQNPASLRCRCCSSGT